MQTEEFTDSFVFKTTDKEKALVYLKAEHMAFALDDIKQFFRANIKYHDPKDGLDYATLEKVQAEILTIFQTHGLTDII
jgi:hypothetical protein